MTNFGGTSSGQDNTPPSEEEGAKNIELQLKSEDILKKPVHLLLIYLVLDRFV